MATRAVLAVGESESAEACHLKVVRPKSTQEELWGGDEQVCVGDDRSPVASFPCVDKWVANDVSGAKPADGLRHFCEVSDKRRGWCQDACPGVWRSLAVDVMLAELYGELGSAWGSRGRRGG